MPSTKRKGLGSAALLNPETVEGVEQEVEGGGSELGEEAGADDGEDGVVVGGRTGGELVGGGAGVDAVPTKHWK